MKTRLITSGVAIVLALAIIILGSFYSIVITIALSLVSVILCGEYLSARKLNKNLKLFLPCLSFALIIPLLSYISDKAKEIALRRVIEKLEEESDGEFSGEDYIKSYEDFREYEETCFEDVDFAMLSFVDEDSLRESAFGKYMGVADRQGPGNVELTVNGRKVKAEFNIAPWDIE